MEILTDEYLLQNTQKPITYGDIIKDFEKLKVIETSKPLSIIGNKIIHYFTLQERLNTKVKKGKLCISYVDFVKNRDQYLQKPYIKRFLENNKKEFSYALYECFKLYFSSVCIFKPLRAKMLYEKYKPKTILDLSLIHISEPTRPY